MAVCTPPGDFAIVGRLKDLIICRGRNVAPQDVEFAAQEVAPGVVRPGCVAAFTATELGDGDDALVVVFECRGSASKAQISEAIAQVHACLQADIGLSASHVVAIREKTIPKTTSGKIRRRATQCALDAHTLKIVMERTYKKSTEGDANTPAVPRSAFQVPFHGGASNAGETSRTRDGAPGAIYIVATEENDMCDAGGGLVGLDAVIHNRRTSHTLGQIANQDFFRAYYRNVVREIGENVVGHALEDDQPFGEMGVTSIMVPQISDALQQVFSAQVPSFALETSDLFDAPTIALLAEKIESMVDAARHASHQRTPATHSPNVFRTVQSGTESTEVETQGDTLPEIVVVGMACELPGGVASPEEFWELLLRGDDAVGTRDGDTATKAERFGGFVDGSDAFDATAFGIAASVAEAMQPQQRRVLQVAYDALHRAGWTRQSLSGKPIGTGRLCTAPTSHASNGIECNAFHGMHGCIHWLQRR